MEVGAVDGDALVPFQGFEFFLGQDRWEKRLVIFRGVLACNSDVLGVLENNFNGGCVVIEILQFFKSLCFWSAASTTEFDAIDLG